MHVCLHTHLQKMKLSKEKQCF